MYEICIKRNCAQRRRWAGRSTAAPVSIILAVYGNRRSGPDTPEVRLTVEQMVSDYRGPCARVLSCARSRSRMVSTSNCKTCRDSMAPSTRRLNGFLVRSCLCLIQDSQGIGIRQKARPDPKAPRERAQMLYAQERSLTLCIL
jgi:hypothetical protein